MRQLSLWVAQQARQACAGASPTCGPSSGARSAVQGEACFPNHLGLGLGLGQHSPDAQTCQQKAQSRGGLGSPWEVVLAQALAAGLVHGLPLGKGPE